MADVGLSDLELAEAAAAVEAAQRDDEGCCALWMGWCRSTVSWVDWQQRRQRQQQQRYEPVPVDTGTVDEEDAGSTAEEVVEMDEDTLEVEVDKDTLLAAGVVAAVQELEARSVSEETESFRPGEWRRQDKKRRSAAAVSAGDEAAKAWAAQLAIELEVSPPPPLGTSQGGPRPSATHVGSYSRQTPVLARGSRQRCERRTWMG